MLRAGTLTGYAGMPGMRQPPITITHPAVRTTMTIITTITIITITPPASGPYLWGTSWAVAVTRGERGRVTPGVTSTSVKVPRSTSPFQGCGSRTAGGGISTQAVQNHPASPLR